MKAVLSRSEKTNDCRVMTDIIRENFITMRGRVNMLNTAVPSTVAYRKAATAQVPVHWIDSIKAAETMHELLWELIPSVTEMYAPNHKRFVNYAA